MWVPFFERLMVRMDGSRPRPSVRDVEQAYEFWRIIPDAARRGWWPFSGPTADRLARAFSWHRAAEAILMVEAERLGLDSSPIRKSGEVCYNLLRRRPRFADKKTSKNLVAYWPHCLGPRLTGLSAEEKQDVRAGESVIARLFARLPDQVEKAADLASGGQVTGGGETPDDLIATAVAVRDYRVSRSTLRRLVAEGKIHDYREPGHKKNAALKLSRAEVASKYPSSKK